MSRPQHYNIPRRPHRPSSEREDAASCPRARRRIRLRRALIGALLLTTFGCGGGEVAHLKRPLKPLPERSSVQLFPAALRLAALARVHQRAGFDMMAGEYFHAAYRDQPKLSFILSYAQSCERVGHFAEAHQAYLEALNHQLSDDERARIQGEAERLKTLVSPMLVQISIQVDPEDTLVSLQRKDDPDSDSPRLVLGDSTIYLKPGLYKLRGKAKGHLAQEQTVRLGMYDRQLLTLRLRNSKRNELRIAGGEAAPETISEQPVQVAAEAKPKKTPPKQPEDKTEPEQVAQAPQPDLEATPAKDQNPDVAIDEPSPPSSPHTSSSLGPLLTAGVGVLGLGAGAYFGYMAKTYAGYANGLNPKSSKYDKNFKEQSDLATTNAMLATWSFVAGGVLTAAGTTWWILSKSAKSSAQTSTSSAPSLAVLPGPLGRDGRGLIATWRF